MTDKKTNDARPEVVEAKKALSRYDDWNSKPNPAHLADAIRGLLSVVEQSVTPTDDEREAVESALLATGVLRFPGDRFVLAKAALTALRCPVQGEPEWEYGYERSAGRRRSSRTEPLRR